jgi:hypothetical protein
LFNLQLLRLLPSPLALRSVNLNIPYMAAQVHIDWDLHRQLQKAVNCHVPLLLPASGHSEASRVSMADIKTMLR